MAEERAYELTITATNSKGEQATVHGELVADAACALDAATLVSDATIKQLGNNRFREIDGEN